MFIKKGGQRYKSGDIVNCKNIKCLKYIKSIRKKDPLLETKAIFVVLSKQNSLYKISTINDYSTNVNKIQQIMEKNVSMTKKRKLLEKITIPFYSVYSYELSSYVPIIKNSLSEIDNKTLIQPDFFAMDTHGSEFQLKPDIPLYKDQYVIMNCNPDTLTYAINFEFEFAKFFKNESDILNFFREHPETKYCVYQNYVPDLSLTPQHKQLRYGLYRIPIHYDFDPKKKLMFIREKMEKLHKKNKISKKIYEKDFLYKNPFLKITSEKYYTNLKKCKINLKNVINKLQKKYKKFTLLITACRSFDNNALYENKLSMNFQKSKLFEPILTDNTYF